MGPMMIVLAMMMMMLMMMMMVMVSDDGDDGDDGGDDDDDDDDDCKHHDNNDDSSEFVLCVRSTRLKDPNFLFRLSPHQGGNILKPCTLKSLNLHPGFRVEGLGMQGFWFRDVGFGFI